MNNKKKTNFKQETSSERPKNEGQEKEETGSKLMNLITGSEETKARGTSEVNLNFADEQKVYFDPILDGFTNNDAFMLKI